ncbi:response regulator [Pontimicrobium sp. IMCC45349]|uniref:response regulator n=1 Tax=Pontimicrobium sp. IMCC45349 TaxID=3391574 RepID=UPI0039A0A8E0
MNKVKVLVVEDEIIIADNICDTLTDLGYQAFEPAISYTEAISVIEEETPDIAILDIQLSGKKTGIDIAKKIKEEYDFPFIFLTSNTDAITLNEAKKVMPPAYLVKPFSKEELYTSIEIALYNYSNKTGKASNEGFIINDALFIKEKGAFIKLLFEDILFLRSAHVYAEIILKNGTIHVVRTSLNDILNKLNHKFIRVHRGYIINTIYLNQISHNCIKLDNYDIPIGKKFKENLINKLNLI